MYFSHRDNIILSIQRSRKMRVFDAMNERMVYDPFLVQDNGGWAYYETDRDYIDGIERMCIPMDWTGLTDKKGKEIYEGDILKANDGSICVVFRDKRDAGWAVQLTQEHDTLGFLTSFRLFYIVEVIGNIFENADLL